MKRLSVTIFLLFAGICGFAQKTLTAKSPVISTKRVYLQYGNQKDSLLIPVISNDYPALQKAFSDSVLFSGDKLPDVVDNYSTCGCGVTSLNYKVEYSNNLLVSIRLLYEGMVAYPSSYQKWLTLFVEDGKPIPLNTVLGEAGMDYVLQKYKAVLISRIKRNLITQTHDADAISARKELLEAARGLKAHDIISKFLITPKGLLVTTDNVLPHVIQSFEPPREVLFTRAELRKFIAAYSVEPGWHTTIKKP